MSAGPADGRGDSHVGEHGDERALVLVSACLAGVPCRYDGRDSLEPDLRERVERGEAVVVCPEVLGGLPTPREPAEIVGGDGGDVLDGRARVVTRTGRDVTEAFVAGARATLALARLHGARKVVLKARSPSCGAGLIHDGTFSGRLREGDGVTAALLRRHGIHVEVR
ncbi:MAG: DUF523 domain-containing protein [Clostridia bacterium]|nr:DUF523 domain-containing protein [Clostridia bacterium]